MTELRQLRLHCKLQRRGARESTAHLGLGAPGARRGRPCQVGQVLPQVVHADWNHRLVDQLVDGPVQSADPGPGQHVLAAPARLQSVQSVAPAR